MSLKTLTQSYELNDAFGSHEIDLAAGTRNANELLTKLYNVTHDPSVREVLRYIHGFNIAISHTHLDRTLKLLDGDIVIVLSNDMNGAVETLTDTENGLQDHHMEQMNAPLVTVVIAHEDDV
jgi:hypothetical protein